MKKPIVVLTGPTAVGKTNVSIQLAKQIGGEIISADSMQVYKYMDIGSAKITAEEMQGVPHHLIDALLPSESFHVVRFQELAKKALERIYANGHIPIVTGGTGFYIQALLYDVDFTDNKEDAYYRRELEQFVNEYGAQALHEKLRSLDEKAAEEIHANNTKRVIRALEFYKQTGQKISAHNEAERKKESPYQSVYFVLDDEREHLYNRINLRVDEMMERGLLAEVKHLKEMGYTREMVSMQGLGYKELLSFLDGEGSLEEAVYTIKRDTRHFAKRQITWFKRERHVTWIRKNELDYDDTRILQTMIKHMEGVLCFEDYSGVTSF